MTLPVYISPADVAKVLGWRTERARRWLERSGALFKVGDRWFTSREKLREAFPETWDLVLESIGEETSDDV